MTEQKLWARGTVRRPGGQFQGETMIYMPVEIQYNFGEVYHQATIHIPPHLQNNPYVREIVINFMGKDYKLRKIEPRYYIPIPNYNHQQEAGYLLNFVSSEGIGGAECIACGTRCFLHDLIDGECTPCRHKRTEWLFSDDSEPVVVEGQPVTNYREPSEEDRAMHLRGAARKSYDIKRFEAEKRRK